MRKLFFGLAFMLGIATFANNQTVNMSEDNRLDDCIRTTERACWLYEECHGEAPNEDIVNWLFDSCMGY